jgi:tRNA dimethylallyltransferase
LAGDKLRIICGPTAAGKSDLALELCEKYNAVIVSADSRQVYREFNVGTAKPTREERARVTHYGIDVIEPDERYSAARWASETTEWIESARGIEKDAVVVGGTGLYIKALVDPLFNAPDQDPVQRAQLERELATMSVDDLRRWCKELDPGRAHLGRTQLLRAIETALLSGACISDLHSRHKAAKETETDGQEPA